MTATLRLPDTTRQLSGMAAVGCTALTCLSPLSIALRKCLHQLQRTCACMLKAVITFIKSPAIVVVCASVPYAFCSH